MAKAAKAIREGFHTITPTLTLDNAAAAIEWYKRALGAEEVSRHEGPDGKIMHAELRIGNSPLMVNDVMPGMKGPKSFGGSPIGLYLYVEDADALFNRAVNAGATIQMAMADQFWGDRGGSVVDPQGYSWWIATHKEDLSPSELKQRAEDLFKQTAGSTSR